MKENYIQQVQLPSGVVHGRSFDQDRDEVVARALEAGVSSLI